MTNSQLPTDPEEFYALVQEGGLDNQTLREQIQKHRSHHGSCDICEYIWDQDMHSPIEEFFVNSHSNSVDATVIALAISQIDDWAVSNNAYVSYLSIALNPNSSSDTLEEAFNFMEDFSVYIAFMHSSDEYIADVLRKVALHPMSSESDLRRWISQNHSMHSEAGWYGHDEVDDEDADEFVDLCDRCQTLFKEAQSGSPADV
jgi:hypothetical protein